MPAIGITGGVATGKSSFAVALLRHLPVSFFDADRCVHQLLGADEGLKADVLSEFGKVVEDEQGRLSRLALRDIVFRSPEARLKLQAMIHPRVRQKWQPDAASARRAREVRLFDIPLIYETDVGTEFDRVLVVACSADVQRRRLADNRGLASDVIAGILEAQLDLPAKVARADHVVWNDGSLHSLDAQARLFAGYLRDLYG